MKLVNVLSICLLVTTFVFSVSTLCTTAHHRKVYNVYMGSLPQGEYSPTLHHSQIINQVIDASFASKSLIRSYKRSFNGFAAYLSQEERAKMASKFMALCAGNSYSGPTMFSIPSFAPWMLTVAASDIDRRLVDMVHLGDGSVLMGTSINAFPSSEGESPLVYGEEVTNNCTETDAKNCYNGCVESSRVHQKVVICNMKASIEAVTAAGALGCIVPNSGKKFSEVMPIPVAVLSENDFNLVINYKTSTKNPEVKIFKSEAIRNPAAPLVASSSSRGLSILMPDILKVNDSNPGKK